MVAGQRDASRSHCIHSQEAKGGQEVGQNYKDLLQVPTSSRKAVLPEGSSTFPNSATRRGLSVQTCQTFHNQSTKGTHSPSTVCFCISASPLPVATSLKHGNQHLARVANVRLTLVPMIQALVFSLSCIFKAHSTKCWTWLSQHLSCIA